MVLFLVTSAANFAVVILAGLGLALGILPGRASPALALTPAVVAVATVLLVVLVAPRFLDRVTPTAGTGPAAGGRRGRVRGFIIKASGTLADGVRETVSLLRSGRPQVIIGSIGYLGFDIVVLAACFRAFGPAPPVGMLLLAYVLGQLGGLLPLPGGSEASMPG